MCQRRGDGGESAHHRAGAAAGVLGEKTPLTACCLQERPETSNCSAEMSLHETSECFIHGVVPVFNKEL